MGATTFGGEKMKRLQTGQEFKSYKALCESLGEKVCSGVAKVNHLKELSKYYNIEKVKGTNKLKVLEVYDSPRDDVVVYRGVGSNPNCRGHNNKGVQQYLKPLIAQEILNEFCFILDDEAIFITEFDLVSKINGLYSKNIQRISSPSRKYEYYQIMNRAIPKEKDWRINEVAYNDINKFLHGFIKNAVRSSLNTLEKEGCLSVDRNIYVIDGEREASEGETYYIGMVEEEVLRTFMGYESVSEFAWIPSELNRYYSEVNNRLIERGLIKKKVYRATKVSNIDRLRLYNRAFSNQKEFKSALVSLRKVTREKTINSIQKRLKKSMSKTERGFFSTVDNLHDMIGKDNCIRLKEDYILCCSWVFASLSNPSFCVECENKRAIMNLPYEKQIEIANENISEWTFGLDLLTLEEVEYKFFEAQGRERVEEKIIIPF